MVFNGALVCAVADVSAAAWQRILRRRERLSSQQLLGILCCVPLERVGRSACYTYSPSSSSSSSESDLLLDGHREGSPSEPDLPLDGDSEGSSFSSSWSTADSDDDFYHAPSLRLTVACGCGAG